MSPDTKEFKSEVSNDRLEVEFNIKSHTANFILKQIDKISENIKLIGDMIHFLKINDIKWIVVKTDFHFEIVQNMVWYKNKLTGAIHCHIEDFEKFYLKNMSNFIKPNIVHVNLGPDDEGWVTVTDSKKQRGKKINELKKEISIIAGDWNKL